VSQRAPFSAVLDPHTELRLLVPVDAPALFDVITRNRDFLNRRVRWSSGVLTLADTQALIDTAAHKAATGDGFHAAIWQRGVLAGGLLCHFINRISLKTEVGYWLGKNFTGQGLATRACVAGLAYLFEAERLHRVEIQCGVDNLPSRAIPERLGFLQEGIKRESEWVTDRYVDHVVYSMLDREWAERREGLLALLKRT